MDGVAAIPIESPVLPIPVVVHPTIGCAIAYSTSSPLTKKWLGIVIWLFVRSTISVSEPSKLTLNISLSFTSSIGNLVLAPKNVPS